MHGKKKKLGRNVNLLDIEIIKSSNKVIKNFARATVINFSCC